jgi:hypothetical protein
MFGKAFASMYTGSMVGAGPTVFAVWGYVIANCRDSAVELNPKLLATIIGCDAGEIAHAIGALCAPDPDSRGKEHDGRRLVHQDGFLYLVSRYEHYRSLRSEDDRTAYMRDYMRKRRQAGPDSGHPANENANLDSCVNSVNIGKPRLAQAEAEADTEADKEKNPPNPPEGGKRSRKPSTEDRKPRQKSERITFSGFLEACRTSGQKPIPPGSAAFQFAEQIGIPIEYLRLAWVEFSRKYGEVKQYKGIRGWRQAFENSVRGNWFKLWWFNGDSCELTTAGVQLRREHDREAA